MTEFRWPRGREELPSSRRDGPWVELCPAFGRSLASVTFVLVLVMVLVIIAGMLLVTSCWLMFLVVLPAANRCWGLWVVSMVVILFLKLKLEPSGLDIFPEKRFFSARLASFPKARTRKGLYPDELCSTH